MQAKSCMQTMHHREINTSRHAATKLFCMSPTDWITVNAIKFLSKEGEKRLWLKHFGTGWLSQGPIVTTEITWPSSTQQLERGSHVQLTMWLLKGRITSGTRITHPCDSCKWCWLFIESAVRDGLESHVYIIGCLVLSVEKRGRTAPFMAIHNYKWRMA